MDRAAGEAERVAPITPKVRVAEGKGLGLGGQVTVADLSDTQEWDETIWRQPGANMYASWSWGDYNSRLNWTVRRIAIRGNGQDLAYIQYQEQRRGPARFILAQGCPILTRLGHARAEEVLGSLIDHLGLCAVDLLAINYMQFQSREGVLALLARRFVPVITPNNYTIELDLRPDMTAILAAADRRWRREINKAESNADLEVVFLADLAERLQALDRFGRMYTELKRRKGFTSSLDVQAYCDLAAADHRLVILEVREHGEPILVRIVHTAPERWTDFFTASNERAKATGAATLAIWRVVERAQQSGARIFDFGGIDPAGNRGVFDFKRALSRNVVQTGPLWLYSHNRLVRNGAAVYLSLRGAK